MPIILTWNPRRWNFEPGEYDRYVRRTRPAPGAAVEVRWSAGRRRHGVVIGERAYLLRQGSEGRGIVASGTVASEPEPAEHWDGSGQLAWYVNVLWSRFVDVNDRLPTEALVERIPSVPWNYLFSSGTPLSEVDADAVDVLWTGSGSLESQPQFAAEIHESALNLLRRLIGVPLMTQRGRVNRVVGVSPPNVLVATERAPESRPVPIQEVQDALDVLRAGGDVELDPGSLGHRSSFVGAVLLTLPGARMYGSSPPIVTLARFDTEPATVAAADRDDRAITFEGNLTYVREVEHRGEQAFLRRQMFGAQEYGTCALCGEVYPVRFLYAAHIKPRSVCSDNEKRNLSRIGMPACAFGCDVMFEAGFVSVDNDGRIVVSSVGDVSGALVERLEALSSRRCPAFDSGTKPYFQWHHENRYRG